MPPDPEKCNEFRTKDAAGLYQPPYIPIFTVEPLTNADLQVNERSHHQPNLSVNSIASIVEPLTPPDISDHHTSSSQQSFSQSCNNLVYQKSNSEQPNQNQNGAVAQGIYGSVNGNTGNTDVSTPHSFTSSSGLNTSIGGNTMRSRFKSLPLVSELDQKFNQFNITSLQSLSHQAPMYYSPSPSTGYNSNNNSTNSIPQIPLNQYPALNSQASSPGSTLLPSRSQDAQKQSQSQGHSFLANQRFHSLPTIKSQGQKNSSDLTSNQSISNTNRSSISSSSTTNSSNYKNYDELNLIPIENLDILKLSVDQYGCRYLQKKLELDNSIKDVIFNKIFNNILDLIVDPFGNYLIQKMADYLTPYQKDLMIEKVHPYLFLISTNQYGTRSLQKIIDGISNTYQMDLVVKGLQMNDSNDPVSDNNIVRLVKDLNGNHVIQKCIFKFPPEKFQFIIDSICLNNNIVRISTHKHGCCVLQKLLNNANFDQILKISKVLLMYLDDLINDQFGNYIIQFLFELDFLKTSNEINFLIDEFFNKIYQNLVKLSCLKFSSNVIEKFIKILKIKKNYFYLNEIIKVINLNFEILIKDKFGNYVIQTLIDQFYDVTELNSEMTALVNTVKNYLPVIKAAPYARKIQLKIQQLESNYTSEPLKAMNNNGLLTGIAAEGLDQYQHHQQLPYLQAPFGNPYPYDYSENTNHTHNVQYYPPRSQQQGYSNNNNGNNNRKSFIPQNNGSFTGY